MREQAIKVLVIDDSAEMRNFIREYLLAPNEFAVDMAEDGLTGLVKAQDPSVNLILLDYELPKLNGVQVLRRLRKEGIKTPVILMTSHGSEQLAVEVFQLGVQNYLMKPFDITKATEAIADALQMTYLEQQKQQLLNEVMKANTEITRANEELKQQLNLLNVVYSLGKTITLIHPSQTLERIVDAAVFLTDAEEGRMVLVNPRTGKLQLNQPIQRKKASLEETPKKQTRTLSVMLESFDQRVGTLSVEVAVDQLAKNPPMEYEYMLKLLAGYANIALQNLYYIRQIQAQKEQEKRIIRGVFERYVASPVVDELLKQPAALKLGGHRQEVTVLFADLRAFSAFASRNSPEETVDTINQYIEAAVEAIFREEGTLDKFIGDAVMAFFNAPLPQADHVLRAIRAALALRQAVIEVQARLPLPYRLNFGIGVCVGEAVVGNVGTPKLMNYTVIGSSVNKAKRLQENAQGGQILISQETFEIVRSHVQVRSMGLLHLKGQATPDPVYEVIGLVTETTVNGKVYPPASLGVSVSAPGMRAG